MGNRRDFLQLGMSGLAAAVTGTAVTRAESAPLPNTRRFHFVQVDVFASRRLQGNPLAVFTDARGLSDPEMQAIARETNLEETTCVFPRVEIKRPSHIFVKAAREGEKVVDVRVGGNAVGIAEGEYSL
jgi:predicted PhzF superfamily epimerase YddE/YHI9